MQISSPKMPTIKQNYNNSISFQSKSIKADKHSRSRSLLLQNKLTKSYFSLHDTSLNNRASIEKSKLIPQYKPISKIKCATSVLLQRYSSEKKDNSQQYHNITETQIPKIYLRKPFKQSTPSTLMRAKTQLNTRNNKFKLLFRQPARKSASQRKVQRLDRKISDLKIHNRYLLSLEPKQKKIMIEEKKIPKGVIVGKQRINKLAKTLVQNMSTYFTMYQHEKRVGDLIKTFDGYNEIVHKVLFESRLNARKIEKQEQIQRYFWVFQEQDTRPQFFGEEDFSLYSALQNLSLKMQKSSNDIKRNFAASQERKMIEIKKQIAKKLTINQRKLTSNNQYDKIINFVDNRRRHNQDRREQSFAKLQSLGVRFNIDQRNKQLILTERQKIMKNYVVKDFK